MNELKILSYNIWFDEYQRTERLFSLFDNIKYYDPDVVCLQEVLNFQYDTIKNRTGYDYCFPESLDEGYGCVILSKYPIIKSKNIKMPGKMGRYLVISLIEYKNKKIIIGNTHFESEFSHLNSTKLLQYKYVSTIINKISLQYDDIIFCSDTNVLHNEEQIFNEKFKHMDDSWVESGKDKNNQYTYDYFTNVNLQTRNIKLQCRIDRILYRTNNIVLKNFKLIRGIFGIIQPSDHHGILTTFEL